MNLGNSEPRQVAGESSLQSGRRANKRRRNGHNDGVDDGPKYPPGRVAVPSFECPFCKDDPHRYAECRGYRLTRLSDVMQHISRQHRIGEVRLGFETLEEEDVVLYCARCRFLFRGRGASHRLDIHMNPEVECQPEPANIEQSGVMLPKEYEGLRDELRSYPRHDETFRWNIIWNWCFPGKPCPSSPYIEIILPRAEVQSIIQDELASMTGLSQEEAQSIARRSADRIYNTLSEPRSSPSVPPQAQSDSVQIAPVSNYHVPTYLASNPTLTSQPLQSQTQGYNSRLAQLGVYGMPTGVPQAQSGALGYMRVLGTTMLPLNILLLMTLYILMCLTLEASMVPSSHQVKMTTMRTHTGTIWVPAAHRIDCGMRCMAYHVLLTQEALGFTKVR